ncbi:hypothetical protein ADUPG1_012616, partial [Aduncisulcus paluster]
PSGILSKRHISNAHTKSVNCISTPHPHPSPVFLSGGADGTVKLWDCRSGTVCVSVMKGSDSIDKCVLFRESGVCASSKNKLFFIDIRGTTPVRNDCKMSSSIEDICTLPPSILSSNHLSHQGRGRGIHGSLSPTHPQSIAGLSALGNSSSAIHIHKQKGVVASDAVGGSLHGISSSISSPQGKISITDVLCIGLSSGGVRLIDSMGNTILKCKAASNVGKSSDYPGISAGGAHSAPCSCVCSVGSGIVSGGWDRSLMAWCGCE